MNKIELITLTGSKTFNFHEVIIYTKIYTKVIKSNSIYSSSAAKLVIKFMDKVTILLLLQPIIISDHKGNIKIWTNASLNKVMLLEPYVSKNYSLDRDFKYYKYKQNIGLLSEEQWIYTHNKAFAEVLDLQSKLVSFLYKDSDF